MGAWDEGPLGNDTAADWFYFLDSSGIYELIEAGFESNCLERHTLSCDLYDAIHVNYVYNWDKENLHEELLVKAASRKDLISDPDFNRVQAFAETSFAVVEELLKTLNKNQGAYPEEVRAASWLLVQLAPLNVIHPDTLDTLRTYASENLSSILSDGDWVASWNSPSVVSGYLKQEIKAVLGDGEMPESVGLMQKIAESMSDG